MTNYAERPRRRCGAQEKPPGIFRPRNIPARWSGAVTSHVPFSNFGDHRSGAPLPKIFWGIFFSGVLGFLDARRGRAGPSPPLYGPDFLTIPSQNFLESKTELEATEMNPRTAMICIACARISDRDVVDAGRGTK